MLKGILTKMLSKEVQAKGYELSEDEDFFYVYLDGKLVGVFSRQGINDIPDIERFIQEGLWLLKRLSGLWIAGVWY